MAQIQEFTHEKRRELFDLGRGSLFFYCKSILGFDDLTEDLHWRYCRFLERPTLRKLVVVFRGGLKSSVGTIGFSSWRSLYVEDHMTKLVEQKADNAFRNHFFPVYYIFRESKRADFLSWLYGDYGPDLDMRRIPDGFKGWNAHQIDFIRRGELTLPSITYGGIDSAFEGWHGNLVLGDDLEGADEDKTDVPNEDALRFIEERAVPLLRNPGQDMILDIGTLHGPKPHLAEIRRREIQSRADGNPPVWDIFWEPLIRSDGSSSWPERFTPQVVAGLKMNPRMWGRQYQLEESVAEDLIFNIDQIRANAYQWAVPRRLISYTRKRWQRDQSGAMIHDTDGYPKITEQPATISPLLLRPFLHADPKHVKGPKHSDDEAAIVVTATNWDQHVFVLETWSGDVGLEEFAEKLYFFYRKYRPWRVTMGAVGAERWFWDYAKMLERGKYSRILSLPDPAGHTTTLPRLTSRLEPAENHTHQGKDDWIVRQLEPWFSFGMVHCYDGSDRPQEQLLTQLGQAGTAGGRRDLADALAQGPKVWSFPNSQSAVEARHTLAHHRSLFLPHDPDTGYFRPWAVPKGDLEASKSPDLLPDRF